MNRSEYMKELAYRLRRLPKEDFDRAMEYYEEYFDEAGEENEAKAVSDLGTPSEAANALILNLAQENARTEPPTLKRGASRIWVGLLALFAAPIALPLAFAGACVFLALVITAAALFLSVAVCSISTLFAGIFGIIGSLLVLSQSFSDGLATLGLSLCILGAGSLFSLGLWLLGKWLVKKLSALPGKIIKGGIKHEAQ